MSTPAAPVRITVDMVTPTKGLVTIHGTDHGGTVLNTAKRESTPGAGWYAEDTDGNSVTHGARGARAATTALARHHGILGPLTIEVDEEWRRTGNRD
ncbi:hypothetical protein ACFQ6C_25780 [Streptomyces sp. NPDC056454]|uniref:hypothetical protein n=1 Tax=Streptomyces sp. NPDC056454 TaxID=3345823 RepID=UPI00367999AE